MIVTQRNVLGGPERDLTAATVLRRALQAECAPLDVPGLDELDVMLALGGSVTPSAGPATGGPFATGKSPAFTITKSGSATATVTVRTS